MTATTPAKPPTDRNLTGGGAPSSNRMGWPTRRVVTVLLLCGVLICGSSATIPQPPPVTTRQESVLRPTSTLSSHNNNVVVNADDADGTTIPPPPPSPSPSSVKAHSDTKALLHQVTLLSECHGHDGDCTTMSLFSSLLALTIPILKHGGVILREVVSGSTTLSFDNGSLVAIIGVTIVVYVSILRFLLFRPSFRGRNDDHNGTTTVTFFSLVSAPVFPWFKSVIFGVAKYPKSSLRRPRYGGNGNPAAVMINRKWCQHMAAAFNVSENRTCVSFAPDVEFNGGNNSSADNFFLDSAIFWWSAEEQHGIMARVDPEEFNGNQLTCYNNETGQLEIYDNDDDDG